MSKNINRAVSLTSYLVTLPKSRYLIGGMFILGAIFGLFFSLASGNPIQSAIIEGTLSGIMVLSLPALLVSILIKLMIRKMPYRRIAATAFAGEFIYAIAYTISFALIGINSIWAQLVLMIGAALVFVVWYLIARFVFILKYRSVFFAILQLLFYLIALMSRQEIYSYSDVTGMDTVSFLHLATRFYVSSFVLLAALVLFMFIINAPMKKSFGLRSTDAIAYFFGQWLYHNKDMEKAFAQVGEKVKTVVSVMIFKRKNDTIYFVTPYVHYGPFGNLGGSEFSYLIAKEMEEKYPNSNSFVFHGTVTHDLNPVATTEMHKIIHEIDQTIKESKPEKTKVSLTFGKSEECKAECLNFENFSMVNLSRAPLVTEDINFGLGLSLLFAAEKKSKNAMIVDQHNSETGDITSFEPASIIGYNYLKAVENALASKGLKKELEIGVATSAASSPIIGKGGIKVAIFSTEPQYVLILIDCNGITPEFREKVDKTIVEMGKNDMQDYSVGIFTTDTHQTNMVKGVVNPLKDENETLQTIVTSVKQAAGNMEKSLFYSDKKWFEINVVGAKQSIEVISTVNSIVAISKIILPLLLLAAVLLLIALFDRFSL